MAVMMMPKASLQHLGGGHNNLLRDRAEGSDMLYASQPQMQIPRIAWLVLFSAMLRQN
jgi:hypothetical protein